MHSLLFNLKRAHHQSLSFLRRVLKPFKQQKITPARFDFLYAIYCHAPQTEGYERREAFMSDIHMALGCVKSNISRYVKLAEAEKWIETDWDGRTILMLTKPAVALIERILALLQETVDANVAQCVAPTETHAANDASPSNAISSGSIISVVDPHEDRHLQFERSYRAPYENKEFRELRRKTTDTVRSAIRTKVRVDIVQAALRRIRAVFFDVRLLDIYDPSFVSRVEPYGHLNWYYGEDGWSWFRDSRRPSVAVS